MRVLILACIAALLLGCGEKKQEGPGTEQAPAPEKSKSAAETLRDGFTGKTAVEAGKRARKKIDKINQKRDKQFDEVLDNQ